LGRIAKFESIGEIVFVENLLSSVALQYGYGIEIGLQNAKKNHYLKTTTIEKRSMEFAEYLEPFSEYPVLKQRILSVLKALPTDVQRDFLDDPRFGVTLYNYEPGKGWSLWMPTPGPPGEGSRRVVLKPKLDTTTEKFAKYVIAHEFAHAFLRNGGWGTITDIEEAADALAASWGFHRPAHFG